MPLPKVQPEQQRDEFVSACMASEVMNREYPAPDRRAAVCHHIYDEHQKRMRKEKSAQ